MFRGYKLGLLYCTDISIKFQKKSRNNQCHHVAIGGTSRAWLFDHPEKIKLVQAPLVLNLLREAADLAFGK